VPPHWSVPDWLEEMHAQAAAAACQAIGDFQPRRGVPWGAFMRLRVLASLRTRHRQEWSYALHCHPEAGAAAGANPADEPATRAAAEEGLRPSLDRLHQSDRRLLHRLFWEGCTEADLAAELGVAQSTVNKRKQSILHDLRRTLDRARDND
jgi:DNA-directed RNA polymerase specialized sigma24 family protein